MRRSNLIVPVLAVGLVATFLVTGARNVSRTSVASAPVAASLHASDAPASCKPRPPVVVQLVRQSNDTWQVALEAYETTLDVQVRIGTGDVGHAGRTLWSGSLQAGERRTFEARIESGRQDAWAECEIAAAAGTTLRSVAVAPVAASRSRSLAAAENGRIVVDPNTGAGVFEYRGQVEVTR